MNTVKKLISQSKFKLAWKLCESNEQLFLTYIRRHINDLIYDGTRNHGTLVFIELDSFNLNFTHRYIFGTEVYTLNINTKNYACSMNNSSFETDDLVDQCCNHVVHTLKYGCGLFDTAISHINDPFKLRELLPSSVRSNEYFFRVAIDYLLFPINTDDNNQNLVKTISLMGKSVQVNMYDDYQTIKSYVVDGQTITIQIGEDGVHSLAIRFTKMLRDFVSKYKINWSID